MVLYRCGLSTEQAKRNFITKKSLTRQESATQLVLIFLLVFQNLETSQLKKISSYYYSISLAGFWRRSSRHSLEEIKFLPFSKWVPVKTLGNLFRGSKKNILLLVNPWYFLNKLNTYRTRTLGPWKSPKNVSCASTSHTELFTTSLGLDLRHLKTKILNAWLPMIMRMEITKFYCEKLFLFKLDFSQKIWNF